MILGTGIDIVNIKRIESVYSKFNNKFVNKILSYPEKEKFFNINMHRKKIAFLAKKFAAKEAIFKSFAIKPYLISWQSVSILNNANGSPYILISEKLQNLLKDNFGYDCQLKIHISIADEREYCVANAIFEIIT